MQITKRILQHNNSGTGVICQIICPSSSIRVSAISLCEIASSIAIAAGMAVGKFKRLDQALKLTLNNSKRPGFIPKKSKGDE